MAARRCPASQPGGGNGGSGEGGGGDGGGMIGGGLGSGDGGGGGLGGCGGAKVSEHPGEAGALKFHNQEACYRRALQLDPDNDEAVWRVATYDALDHPSGGDAGGDASPPEEQVSDDVFLLPQLLESPQK